MGTTYLRKSLGRPQLGWLTGAIFHFVRSPSFRDLGPGFPPFSESVRFHSDLPYWCADSSKTATNLEKRKEMLPCLETGQ